MKTEITATMNVNNNLVGVLNVRGVDYISLTDLARYKNPDNPGDVIIKWMSNKSSFDFYSLWEELSNEDFKLAEFREFKMDSSTQSFTMSPSRWIKTTKDGNIRDSANILYLVVLSNLEVLNANMIEEGICQKERSEKLNSIARKQLQLLVDDKNIMGINKRMAIE